MTTTTLSREIEAPIDRVFDTVADITNFQQAIPHIANVEFLSEARVGVGTRFRETRRMPNGREMSNDLEVTEHEANDHVRIVTESHGTVWDTVFRVRESGGATELTMVMKARAQRLLPRLLNPLLKGMIAKEIGKDLDAVKAYCEAADA